MPSPALSTWQYVAVCCSVLPCIAMCCSVLQCTYIHTATSTSNRHQRPVQRHAPHLHTLQMRRICLQKSPIYPPKNTANETLMSAKEPYVSENELCVSDARTHMSVDFHFYMRPSISIYFESGGGEHIQSGKCMYAWDIWRTPNRPKTGRRGKCTCQCATVFEVRLLPLLKTPACERTQTQGASVQKKQAVSGQRSKHTSTYTLSHTHSVLQCVAVRCSVLQCVAV